jgi:hypothetical protein
MSTFKFMLMFTAWLYLVVAAILLGVYISSINPWLLFVYVPIAFSVVMYPVLIVTD